MPKRRIIMQDFVKRLIIERDELITKWEKLRDFLQSEKTESLDNENLALLSTQFNIMGAYLCILERRIDINNKE